VYPFIGLLLGARFPRWPAFGVPCPTALLTAGLLLVASSNTPRWLPIIPVIWCVIAGSAAVLLRIPADWALFVAGAALVIAYSRKKPQACQLL
jgi:hypothetical protein